MNKNNNEENVKKKHKEKRLKVNSKYLSRKKTYSIFSRSNRLGRGVEGQGLRVQRDLLRPLPQRRHREVARP